MKTEMYKRIWSALLVLILVLQCMPLGAVRAELTDPTQETSAAEVPAETGTAAETTEASEATEATEASETTEATEASEATSAPETEPAAEAVDSCPYCEETVAEDGTVTHALNCTAQYVYDGTADVGRYAVLSDFSAEYGVLVSGEHDSDTAIVFYYDEFGADTVMRITDWYWDAGTTGLWYRVELYSGSFPESTEDYTWPDPAWILQGYTENFIESEAALEFVTVELPDTDSDFYCSLCDSYDCVLPHPYCSVCEIFDCTEDHIWCGSCGCFDCGLEHEDIFTPPVEPVIPETPDLTADVSVFIIQENGEPVPEEGLVVEEGRKISISAWGNASWCSADESSVSYRWQIRYDKDLWRWADIQGQTGKGILVSSALFQSLQDREPAIRCVITSGTQERFSAPVALQTVQTAALEEPAYEASVTDAENTPLADEDTVDVFIQYEFQNGTPASNPRVSNLPKGKAYATQNPITVPNIPGYSPTLELVGEGDVVLNGYQLTISFTADQMNQDRTVRIVYQPAPVNVVLRYYWQNLNDDDYTEKEHETIQVITNQDVPDVTKEYPGFRRLEYEKTKAAADGSTEVKVYFDREYYLMEFELGGGYGVEPIYARYGTSVTVNDPVRPGYRFDGWQLNGGDTTIPATMPADNCTYKAKWTPVNASYKVAYWIANDDGTRTLLGTDIKWGTADDTVDGIDNLGKTDNKGNTVTDRGVICGNEPHTEDCLICEDETHKTHVHSLSCYVHGGANNPSPDDLAAITEFENNAPESGYIYVINAYKANGYDNNDYYKLYFDDGDGVVEQADFYSVSMDQVSGGVIRSEYASNDYRVTKYRAKTICGLSHNESCYACEFDKHAHEHSNECYQDTKHLLYVDTVEVGPEDGKVTYRTDKNVTIKGDNTTVVNVYYVYKKYTIRYIYARQSTSGGYYQLAKSTGNGEYWNTDQVKWDYSASTLPNVTDPDGSETPKFFKEGGYNYYYISLTARYGEEIASKWPSANVESTGGYDFGSWGAGPYSPYRQKYGNAHANIVGPYPVMSDDMIDPDPAELSDNTYRAQTMVAWWGASGDYVGKHAYHIYLELVQGETQVAGGTYKEYNGKTYRLDKTYTFTAAHNGNTRVDPLQLDGLTVVNEDKTTQANSQNYNNEGNCAICGSQCRYCNDYFYDSISYTLSFWNYDGYLMDGSGSPTKYRTPLSTRFNYTGTAEDGTPLYGANQLVNMPENYPESLEPGAYVFEGWYTSPQFAADTKVTDEIAQTMRMPAENLMLYAHWVPKEYTVTILDKKDGDVLKTVTKVQHGSTIEEHEIKNPTAPADKSGFKHVGWFYEENGVEKAFDFANSPVKSDLTIYAKWSANVLCPFEVRFVLESNPSVQIADSITGTIMAGSRTIDAKGGTDLYEDYQTGYFPNQKSHTIVPKIEADAQGNLKTIVYTFEYTEHEKVPYTVRYLIRNEDGTTRPALIVASGSPGYRPAAEDEPATSEAYVKEDENNVKAVVTETYIPITGYLPVGGTYQQTLVVTPDGNNEIIFYYEKDTEHALVQINHYIQNLDGKTWSEYQTSTLTGDIGKSYSQSAIDIPHFTFSDSITKQYNITEPKDPYLDTPLPGTVTFDEGTDTVSGTLGQTGLQLNLYYTRNTYTYQVRYLEQGKGTVLLAPKTETAKYNQLVTEIAPDIHIDLDDDGREEDFRLYEASQPVQTAQIQDNNTLITFYYVRCTQDLTVTKMVAGTATPDAEMTYSFRLEIHAREFNHEESYPFVIQKDGAEVRSGYIPVTTVDGGNPYLAFSLKDGETITFTGLPTAKYTVKELPLPVGYYAPGDQEVTLTENAQVDVTVTNTYAPAGLEISKTVENEEAGNLPEVQDFGFTIVFPEGVTPESSYPYTVSGQGSQPDQAMTVSLVDGRYKGFIDLKKGETARFDNLPTGTYAVTEEDYSENGYDTSVSTNGSDPASSLTANVDVTKNQVSRVDFKNKFPVGDLKIQKTVTKEAHGTEWNGDTFRFTVIRANQGKPLVTGKTYNLYLDEEPKGQATVDEDGQLEVSITFDEEDAETLQTAGASAVHTLRIENLPAGTYAVTEAEDADYTQTPLRVEALEIPHSPVAAFTNHRKVTLTYHSNYPDGSGLEAVSVSDAKAHNGIYQIKTDEETGFAVTGYTFDGWNTAEDGTGTDYTEGQAYTGGSDLTLHAKWKINTYTVTWEDADGTVLEIDTDVPYGTTPTYEGEPPVKAPDNQYTYTFESWDPEVSPVIGDVTYIAVYTGTVKKYTVLWLDEDGTLLEMDEQVPYGTPPTYEGEPPVKAPDAQFTYTFSGWTPEVSPVTGDVAYTAVYTAAGKTYTVYWVNDDGTVLEKDENVARGTMPEYNGSTPTKAEDAQYVYTFSEWSPTVSEVTGDAVYTARYTGALKNYTVTWVNEDRTVLETDEKVPYGTMPEYNGGIPVKPSPEEGKTYSFDGWSPLVSPVTGDITYTAQFTEDAESYTITYVSNYPPALSLESKVTAETKLHGKDYTIRNAGTLGFVADGYTCIGWNTAAYGSGINYAADTLFTGNKDLTLYAQWVDSRLDGTHKVFIGINVPYHQPAGTYEYPKLNNLTVSSYHIFPDEPLEIYFASLRAYFNTTDGKWYTNTDYNNPISTEPWKVIDPALFKDENYKTNYLGTGSQGLRDPDVYQNIDTDGSTIRKYFSLSEEAYKGIIGAWLSSRANDASGTDIPWDKNLTVEDFKAVPYVIKYHGGHWYVDMIILAKNKYILTYIPNMADGYSGAKKIPAQWYGENYEVTLEHPGTITKTEDGLTYTGTFQYWQGDDGKIYNAGEEITMVKDLTLTAKWKYEVAYRVEHYKKDPITGTYVRQDEDTQKATAILGETITVTPNSYDGYYVVDITPESKVLKYHNQEFAVYYDPIVKLTISQEGLGADESAIYHVYGNGVDMLVEIQGGESVTLEHIPVGSYTVTELTGWTWKYDSDAERNTTNSSKTILVTEAGPNNLHFDFDSTDPDWLGGEGHENNEFLPK